MAAKGSKGEKGSGGLVGVAIVTLLAAAAGLGFGFYLSGDLKMPEPPKPVKGALAAEKPKVAQVGAKLLELEPIITNLAEPKTAYVRIEGSLVLEGEVENAVILAGKISEDVVAYLKTTKLAQFEGASSFQSLREDLNDRARVRGGPQVRELVIHGMVIE
jgi:flagellar FliL protein